MIIGISGKMRSGKDTVARYIIDNYDFEHLKFSMGIKEVIDKYAYKDNKGVKRRREYQDIGQGIRGILGQNVWVNYTLSYLEEDKDTVFSDVRQINEFKALQDLGATIIYVETPPEVQRKRLESLGEKGDRYLDHETEQIPHYLADEKIINDGTLEDLYKKVDDFMERHGYKKKKGVLIKGKSDIAKG